MGIETSLLLLAGAGAAGAGNIGGLAGSLLNKSGDKTPQAVKSTQTVAESDIGVQDEELVKAGKRRSVASTIRAGALGAKRNSLGG